MNRERKQYAGSIVLHRGLYVVILAVILLALGVGSFLKRKEEDYKNPSFEVNAIQGKPEEGDEYGYAEGETEYGFTFGLAQNLYLQEDKTLVLEAANPQQNDVYLKYVITEEESSKVLFETGVLKPGEYVSSLEPATDLENEFQKVQITVYAFDPETWYSRGKVNVEWQIQPW